MADKTHFTELLAKEPDPLRRMVLINFNMDMLRDPEEALLNYRTTEGSYEKWAEKHYNRILQLTAQRTGIDPAILADKDKRTPEQTRELIETSAQEQMARIELYLGSNFAAATGHISDYCIQRADAQGAEDIYRPLGETAPNEDNMNGELLNVPLLAALYFFATHETIDPGKPDALTDDDKAELTRIFDSLDAFYMDHRGDLKGEIELLSAYLDSLTPKNPKAKKETLEQLHHIRKATSLFINNDKVYNELINAIPDGETSGQLIVKAFTDPKTKQDVITYMALTYEGDKDIVLKGRRAITGFDKAVYNAVSTLYAAGNLQFSAQDVYRTMNGNTRNSPTKGQITRITDSLDKMTYTAFFLDVSDEIKKAGLKMDDKRIVGGAIKSPMLQGIFGEAKLENGRTVTVYRLSAEPILYTYCKSKRHIITVPIALLDTSDATSSTDGITAIREYLLRQIELMKHNKRQNATIRYSTIYEETAIPAPKNRKEAGRMRDQIKAVLDVWTARGYIKGYTDAKEGRSMTGITIRYDLVDQESPSKGKSRKAISE